MIATSPGKKGKLPEKEEGLQSVKKKEREK